MSRVHWVFLGLLAAAALTFWLLQVRPRAGGSDMNESKREPLPVSSAALAVGSRTAGVEIASPLATAVEGIKPSGLSSDTPRVAGRGEAVAARKSDGAGQVPADERMLSAEEILQAMRERYAALTSYTDRGRQTRTWHERNQTYVDVPFRTFFKRPLFYRFEWLGGRAPYQESYWANAGGVFVKKWNEAPYRMNSLPQIFKPALKPASYHVLQFLAPAAVPMEPSFFTGALRLEDDEADGVPCFHLSGKTTLTALDRELWIGKEDFLLRRISTVGPYNYSIGPNPQYFSGRETLRVDYYDVAADVSLPDDLFYPAGAEPL